jgi:hypothetical protein
VLAVDRNRPAGERFEIHAVTAAAKTQLDAVVDEPFALEPVADSRIDQQVDRALFEHAGPDAFFRVAAAMALDHRRGYAGAVQQVRQQQSGRTGPDDGDLCAHGVIRRGIPERLPGQRVPE